MSVVHLLRGYNRQTDRLAVQYAVPENLVEKAAEHVTLEGGDSDVFGIYPLDQGSAIAIARLIGCEMQVTKDISENEFFLEAEADIDTVNQQIAGISPH